MPALSELIRSRYRASIDFFYSDIRSQRIEEQIALVLRRLDQRQVTKQQPVSPIDIQSAIDRLDLQVDQYTAKLVTIQDTLIKKYTESKQQEQIWQLSHDILKGLEKLSLEPRLDRTSSALSGTTEGSEAETIVVDENIVPIAPGLINHPGFQFRDDRLEKADVSKALLNAIERWLDPNNPDTARVYIRTSRADDSTHDLCNRVVYELAMANSQLLCYNGLPREGPPPADGWYTMAHLVWWLSAQMRIPMPHVDGHMPGDYSPDVASLITKLEKTQDNDPVYVVLYLPTESCHDESDRRLYHSLIDGLCKIPSRTPVRILLFSDDADGEVRGYFGTNIVDVNNMTHEDFVPLNDWVFPEFG